MLSGGCLGLCSDQYQFKICDAILGDVNVDNVIKQCCLDQVDEHCDRVAQVLKEVIDTRYTMIEMLLLLHVC